MRECRGHKTRQSRRHKTGPLQRGLQKTLFIAIQHLFADLCFAQGFVRCLDRVRLWQRLRLRGFNRGYILCACQRAPGLNLDPNGGKTGQNAPYHKHLRTLTPRVWFRKQAPDRPMAALRNDMTDTPRSFQEIILRLQAYWAAKGCAIMQPYDMEVGAGTFHPATTLRALGSVPWAAAYVQPSRRPTDGRYGENPNRLQHYYQYQVFIKPNPPDLQALYLGSLEAISIDMDMHDIRFVEDDWESPTLGAWGAWLGSLV